MSNALASVVRVEILPHTDADSLELARTGDIQAVVPKDVYRTGDLAVFVNAGSIIPPDLLAHIGLEGRLAGTGKNRVKPARIRGMMSHGIVCSPDLTGLNRPLHEGMDLTEYLGVTKWIPEIPLALSGEAVPAPDLIPWLEVENALNHPDVFAPGEQVVVTEKVHGSCLLLTVTGAGDIRVSSKGMGSKRLALKESDKNAYWRAVRTWRLHDAAFALTRTLSVDKVALFGEVYGKGIQDLTYGKQSRNDVGFVAFDIAVEDRYGVRWLPSAAVDKHLANHGIPRAPVLYEGPFDAGRIREMATGREQVSGKEAHLREGVVIRPAEERFSDSLRGRAILKYVSDEYLTRGNGTEFQ